jgi:hypothetical protein
LVVKLITDSTLITEKMTLAAIKDAKMIATKEEIAKAEKLINFPLTWGK